MKALVFGAGAQGRVTLDVLRAMRCFDEFGFMDDNAETWGTQVDGVQVGGGLDWAASLPSSTHGIIVALGNPVVRLRVMDRARAKGMHFISAIHPSASMAQNVTLGEGNLVGARAILCTGARVGNGVIINTASILEHDAIVADGVQLAPGAIAAGRTILDKGAFIGLHALVIPRVRIGAYSVVGVASVVINDVPDGVFVLGNPARVVEKAGEDFDWKRLL